MGLYSGISCDKCGYAKEWFSIIGGTHLKRWMREEGWSIGKQILCPNCRKARRNLKAK